MEKSDLISLLALWLVSCGCASCGSPTPDDDYEGDQPGDCSDGLDNDRDGLFDCDDEGCSGIPICSATDADADVDEDAEADADGEADTDPDAVVDADADVEADVDAIADLDCDTGREWVFIRSGSFTMGSPPDEIGRDDDELQHEVVLTRDFEIQRTEVTQCQFEEVMGFNRSFNADCADCPVEMASWWEAAVYCNRLSDAAGLERCYECREHLHLQICEPSGSFASPYDCSGYRLPTEAEWEYAARAGATGQRYGEIDDIAWYRGNGWRVTREVGLLAPNDWGLYDMLGNAWEWCSDWSVDYPSGSLIDPWGPEDGGNRVTRGGGVNNWAEDVRLASRSHSGPMAQGGVIGFRTARTMQSPR